jgi:hypothetical protein
MKKIILVGCLAFYTLLFGLEITIKNEVPQQSAERGFTKFQIDDSFYLQSVGDPSVPVKSVFFEISADKKISDVSFQGRHENSIILNSPLIPMQKNVPLSYQGIVPFISEYSEQYERVIFPENLVHNFGTGRSGNTNIGYISYYSGTYYYYQNEYKYFDSITFNIEFEDDLQGENFSDNYATEQVLKSLNVSGNLRTTDIKYLLITPEIYLDEYEELLEFRRIQGLETFAVTVENIEQNYTGSDFQEKVRNCIIDFYMTFQISFVTLGADTDVIPSRIAVAFDCEYGLYDDENDLRADMYYSCLNGNWNADEDEIYGEEEDEVDYFPEVFVGRISANTAAEVTDYVSRLLEYEKGEHEEYSKAGGFSMELWNGSDSEVCQQYIYEQYFPDFYDITLLYDAENSMENAYALLNQNMNIVQHTGHAGKTALSLEEGSIRTTNLDNLQNEYGGVFYSIGCWSSALDYGSIGEALVMSEEKGMLAYVGNSRYGWGSPSASGFGFSEFYQKEFFKQVFWEDITVISQINALQKLPFIPYFGGTSIYKWCAYQLNEVGDSYFNLINANPADLDYSLDASDVLHFVVTSGGIPLENVVVTVGENQVLTNVNGEAVLPNSAEIVYLYKYGYKFAEIDLEQYQPTPFVADIGGNTFLAQGQIFGINSVLYNPTSENLNFMVDYEFNENEITVFNTSYTSTVEANSGINLTAFTGNILPINESYQMESGKEIFVTQNIYDDTRELITSNTIQLTILAPQISLNFVENPESILPGGAPQFNFEFINSGDFTLDYYDVYYSVESVYFTVDVEHSWHENPMPQGTISTFVNQTIFIDPNTPPDYVGLISLQMETGYNGSDEVFTFTEDFLLPVGNLSWSDDFEAGLNWDCPAQWQTVHTFAHSGDSSFSCRPGEVGTYTASAPSFVYTEGLELSFSYKFKMPMYGNDGVFFLLEYNDVVDTLIFLGAGGALPDGDRPVPNIYIEEDWVEYNLNLDEMMLDELAIGTVLDFKLRFHYAEEIFEFNQYGLMPEIGVFIDDFSFNEIPPENQAEDEPEQELIVLYAFPNPVFSEGALNISFSAENQKDVSAKIYNVKGQLVRVIDAGNSQNGLIVWDLKDKNEKQVSSGLYFIKAESRNEIFTKKVMVIK